MPMIVWCHLRLIEEKESATSCWQRSQFCSLRLPATSGFELVIPRWWCKRFLLHQLPIRRSVYAIIMGVLPWDFGACLRRPWKDFSHPKKRAHYLCHGLGPVRLFNLQDQTAASGPHHRRRSLAMNLPKSRTPIPSESREGEWKLLPRPNIQATTSLSNLLSLRHYRGCPSSPELHAHSSVSFQYVQLLSLLSPKHLLVNHLEMFCILYTLAPYLMSCLSIIICIWSCSLLLMNCRIWSTV